MGVLCSAWGGLLGQSICASCWVKFVNDSLSCLLRIVGNGPKPLNGLMVCARLVRCQRGQVLQVVFKCVHAAF